MELALKGIISGLLVVAATEASRRSDAWAAILVSLPLTSMLALIWIYLERRDVHAVSDLSYAIMWIVLPSIVFFVALPVALKFGLPFWGAFTAATVTMVAAYAGYAAAFGKFGIKL